MSKKCSGCVVVKLQNHRNSEDTRESEDIQKKNRDEVGHSRTKTAIVCPFDIIKPAKVCFYSLIWFLVLTDDGRKNEHPTCFIYLLDNSFSSSSKF